ncbi:I78 family peptidase inhibitor [Herbaspirillum lusitanum]|uniref:I78 family peptidase inhibitor n=1 Tax=Herbaspirillum lusitanum TaxID=213312 RepID=A0ABW9A3S0_9BURK
MRTPPQLRLQSSMLTARGTLALAVIALSACAAPGISHTDDAAMTRPAMRCDAAGAQKLLGRTADADLLAQAQQQAGAASARILGPNDAVTMEFNPTRLNLQTDSKRVIVRVVCG